MANQQMGWRYLRQNARTFHAPFNKDTALLVTTALVLFIWGWLV